MDCARSETVAEIFHDRGHRWIRSAAKLKLCLAVLAVACTRIVLRARCTIRVASAHTLRRVLVREVEVVKHFAAKTLRLAQGVVVWPVDRAEWPSRHET